MLEIRFSEYTWNNDDDLKISMGEDVENFLVNTTYLLSFQILIQ